MHWQKLVSTLVWAAVLCCCTSIVSGMMDGAQRTEVANTLNMMMRHRGWRYMEHLIKTPEIEEEEEDADPIAAILRAVGSGREVVDELNVREKHNQIWTALMCKYGEIIFNYKCLVNHLLGVCQSEERTSVESFQRYYYCVDSLLTKMHMVAPIFMCMKDALGYIYSLVPQPDSSTPKPGVMTAMGSLAEYTRTIRPTCLAKFSERGQSTAETVELEIKTIGEYISQVYDDHVQPFAQDQCNELSENRKWTAPTLVEDFEHKKRTGQIPEDTTMLEYVKEEIDTYLNEFLGKWFFDLGFAYGVGNEISIGTPRTTGL